MKPHLWERLEAREINPMYMVPLAALFGLIVLAAW